ncbi:MAG: uL15 family ribosomal protein [Clostridia bacterium]|nr:uL15 family ribosomal protein [Clostridia bacterium]
MCFFKLFKRKKNKTAEVKTEVVPEAVDIKEEVVQPVEDVQPEPVAQPEVEVRTEPEVQTVEQPIAAQPEAEVQPIAEEPKEEVAQNAPAEVKPVAERPVAVKADGKVFIRVRYNRSFTAKLIQSDDKIKSYYGEIKNELLRYKVKTRTSWRYETFKLGRKLLAKISMRGKTLGLYLALDPKAYDGTKYKINDVSSVANNASVPSLYKIKNDRRCKYSKDLISALMAENGLAAGDTPTEDYVARYPYEELEPLIERKLVKLLKFEENAQGAEEGLIEISEERYEQLTAEADYSEVATVEEAAEEVAEEVVEEIVEEPIEEVVEEVADEQPAEVEEEVVEETAEEVQYPEVVESITVVEADEEIADEVAETFIQESERYSDKTKKDIVNIDTLSRYFNAGDDVTIEEIKKRVPSVNKKATYIKVLARGTLDKALNVEADDFSPSAVKMIVLTGGTVSRTKTRN